MSDLPPQSEERPPARQPSRFMAGIGLLLYSLFGLGFFRALRSLMDDYRERRGWPLYIAMAIVLLFLAVIAWRWWISLRRLLWRRDVRSVARP